MTRFSGKQAEAGEDIIRDIHDAIHADASKQLVITGACGPEKALIVAQLAEKAKRLVFVVVPSKPVAETFLQDLSFFAGPSTPNAFMFPPYNILPFKRLAYNNETAAHRVRTLYKLAVDGRSPAIIAAPVETLLQRVIPKGELCGYAELVMVNEELDRDRLVAKLHNGGYVHSAIVEEPGEYSVRGGIIDIFSPMYDDPLRIELFGDVVDSIRRFSVSSQRKVDQISEAIILPAREAVFEKHRVDDIVRRARAQKERAGITESAVTEFIERLRNEGVFAGIEGLLPLIYAQTDTVFDYLHQNALIIDYDPEANESEAVKNENRATRNYLSACDDNRMCVSPESIYQPWSKVKSDLANIRKLSFPLVNVQSPSGPGTAGHPVIHLSVEDNSGFDGHIRAADRKEQLLTPLTDWIDTHETNGYHVAIACQSRLQADRFKGLLEPYGKHPAVFPFFSEMVGRSPKTGIVTGHLSGGFVFHDRRLAIITEKEIFGKTHIRRSRREKRQAVRTTFLDFSDINIDDFIVHVAHGIGRYKGLEKLTIDAVTNDFMVLEYRGGDKLYLPVDRMDMVQKYLGVDDVIPVIDKLGGTSWEKIKAKAKKSVEKIAGELLQLYAARKVENGHAFGGDDAYYRDFEAGFAFEETEDQVKAIEDVLADMEAPTPMDRLICGDVGYGKTEVALRAAFKAVNDGKQVAVMVPTTLLAEQHYLTFSQRFDRYPVTVECLSRFRSRKEQKEIIFRMQKGTADIVIGTHRLLQKDIGFKDLGLVVIDEEQRFGVKHKEKLKKIRTTVDVLSMTATPIPRTLHMSMLGVRDISIISTPPEMRRPIISYISELDPAVISEAVSREVERGGQVFFVHNNINTIWNMARYLKDLLPEVRLGVAHGRLTEAALEGVMQQFVNREIDVLVTTTIVESGLDIPNANTIIVNRADRFGLAQIYQLRGRVGRADEQAYAYLIVPGEAALGRDAQKRLKVLMEHSDLGAGFQIALHDLKIRGGGAALGIHQSGHISAVGYDMFLQLMEESIAKLKGEIVTEPLEPEINIPVSVFIPESYIPDRDGRLSSYRRLARMQDVKEVADFREELIDRFGQPPPEVNNLLLKIMLKILSKRAGVKRLDMTMDSLSLAFSDIHQKKPYALVGMVQSAPDRFRITPSQTMVATLQKSGIYSLMNQSKKILMEVATYVNN